jgi:hypothetical protein
VGFVGSLCEALNEGGHLSIMPEGSGQGGREITGVLGRRFDLILGRPGTTAG